MINASTTFARVGELACQKNPFLRELRARVISCEPVTVKKTSSKHTDPQTSYNVILSDSILFPEGGGQPCDYGVLIRNPPPPISSTTTTINNNIEHNISSNITEIPVHSVQRRGDMCVITINSPIEIGEEILMQIHWPRRLDHMQHHTAQHLLSAIVGNNKFVGLPTLSWSLTHPFCFIVLPSSEKIKAEVLLEIEEMCNNLIAKAIPVRCDVYSSKEAYAQAIKEQEMKLNNNNNNNNNNGKFRPSRDIPADVTGPIRIITVEENIDSCTCCGTHVSNLSQLQMIKLLHQETKGDTLKLYFIAGDRVKRYFSDMYFREKELMKEMGGVRPEDFITTAVKKNKDFVEIEKKLKNMTFELVKLESEKLINAVKQGEYENNKVILFRRDDVEVEFFNALREALREACPEYVAVFAWATYNNNINNNNNKNNNNSAGQFMIVGPTVKVEKLALTVCEILEGKGGMSKFGYRGKGNIAKWKELIKILGDT